MIPRSLGFCKHNRTGFCFEVAIRYTLIMKVFIIAATTVDGFIGRDAEHLATTWTSEVDKRIFSQLTKQAGTIVMGSRTYATIGRPLPGRRTIVCTTQQIDGVETTSKTPKELVEQLKAEGVQELAVCGGAYVYSQFMQAGVVDELYLDVEPVVFGAGVPLFGQPLQAKLQLLSSQKLNDGGTTLNHYAVLK
jgi:dihydrofolate reductase